MEPHIAEKNSILPLPKQSTNGWSALDRRSYATFVLTVILAYVSALTYLERPLPLAEKIYLIAGSIVFVGLGIFGFAFCKKRNSFLLSLGYLVFQMLLARSIIFVAAAGFIFLIMLPLASQSVILLPRRWMLAFCALLLLVMAVPAGMRFGLEVGIRSGIFNLVGIAFVVYFTLMAVGEHRARAEVERLASELTIANTRLREYATRLNGFASKCRVAAS